MVSLPRAITLLSYIRHQAAHSKPYLLGAGVPFCLSQSQSAMNEFIIELENVSELKIAQVILMQGARLVALSWEFMNCESLTSCNSCELI